MGQRSQIFVKIHNPVKSENNRMPKEDNAKAKKMFGTGKYTILALHHQWLYGRSAVVNVKNMLDITRASDNTYKNPFSKDCWVRDLDEWVKNVMMMVQVQPNPLHPRGIGIECMHFLNSECLDDGKYIKHWDMRKDFTIGDNNDGVSIIDTISRKYCLINIFTYDLELEDGEEPDGIYALPSMTPCSALEYANAYYKGDEEDNKVFADLLSENEVLSLAEVKKLFPKVYKEKVVG